MVYDHQISIIINSWKERKEGLKDPSSSLVLDECITELESLLDDNHDKEAASIWIP